MAAQKVVLHGMGQLAPPTLVIEPHMQRHKCGHPKNPQAVVNAMEEGCNVHPKRAAFLPRQEP